MLCQTIFCINLLNPNIKGECDYTGCASVKQMPWKDLHTVHSHLFTPMACTWPNNISAQHRSRIQPKFTEAAAKKDQNYASSLKNISMNSVLPLRSCFLKKSTAIKPHFLHCSISQCASRAVSHHESLFSAFFACLRTSKLLCICLTSTANFCYLIPKKFQILFFCLPSSVISISICCNAYTYY